MDKPGRERGVALRALSAIALLVLQGCAAGGGGAAGTPAGVPVAPDATAAAVSDLFPATHEAEAGDSLAGRLAGAVFALFPALFEGDQLGARSDGPSGAITVTYLTSTGAQRTSFSGREIDTPSPGVIVGTHGSVAYLEAWEDEDTGSRTDHSRLYFLLYPESGTLGTDVGYFGLLTPDASVPKTGLADYGGFAVGVLSATDRLALLDGAVQMRVDFDRGELSGRIDNLRVTDLGTGGENPLGVDIEFTATNATTTQVLPYFTGSPSGRELATGRVLTGASRVDLRLFGPGGEEIAGTWDLVWNDGGEVIQTYGAFLTARTAVPVFTAAAGVSAPRYAGADTTGFASGEDAGVVFPVSQMPFSGGYVNRTRDAAGGVRIDLKRADDTLVQIDYAPGDLVVGPDATMTATRDEVTWRERAAMDPDGGVLHFARHGEISYVDAFAGPLDRVVYFGFVTPEARVAAQAGFAEYSGVAVGRYRDAGVQASVTGALDLRADFDAGALQGRISSLVVGAGEPGERLLGKVLYLQNGALNGRGAGSLDAGLTGTGCCDRPSGGISGQFFGPGLEEAAGIWHVSNIGQGAYTIEGTFGTRVVTADHPDGIARLVPFASSADETFPLAGHAVDVDWSAPGGAVVSNDPPIEASLAPRADGGVLLSVSRAGSARDVDFVRGDLQSIRLGIIPYFGTDYWQAAVRDDVALRLYGTDLLSYTRFGYWDDRGALPDRESFGVFYTGRETPAAEVPAAGSARYEGWTLGLYQSSEGLARVEGDAVVVADFSGRSVSGELVLGSGEWLTGRRPGDAIPATEVRYVNFLGSIDSGTAGFSGTAEARSASDASVSATGVASGRFFGPAAAELGGAWRVSAPDGSVSAWGTFGAVR